MKTYELQIKSTNSEVKHEKTRYSVKDEIAYFYAVIKNMDKKGFIKQSKINKHENRLLINLPLQGQSF